MPCRSTGDGNYEVIDDFFIDDWLREKIKVRAHCQPWYSSQCIALKQCRNEGVMAGITADRSRTLSFRYRKVGLPHPYRPAAWYSDLNLGDVFYAFATKSVQASYLLPPYGLCNSEAGPCCQSEWTGKRTAYLLGRWLNPSFSFQGICCILLCM